MQKKNTFTQVDNSLLETLYSSKLTAAQLRVMLFIIRQTAGYHRQSHVLSAGFIAKGTGISERAVRRALAGLRKKNIITTRSFNCSPNVITINKTEQHDAIVTPDNTDRDKAGSIPLTDMSWQPMTKSAHKEINKIKSKESVSPTLDDVIEYCHEMSLTIDAERFFDYYEAVGWQRNGQPITNWKAVARNWQSRERTQLVVEYVEKDDWGRPIPPEFV